MGIPKIMKKLVLIALVTILKTVSCYSQDLITKKNGDDVKSKIIEVGTLEIKYKKFDNLNGPIFTILKSDVLIVRYENGTKDIFNEEKKIETPILTAQTEVDLFSQGQRDADLNYKGYKGAGTGTFFTTLLTSPLFGLIPAIACSASKPDNSNLNFPSSELMKKQDYYNGYTQQAFAIKKKKTWKNFGIGTGVFLVAVLLTRGRR